MRHDYTEFNKDTNGELFWRFSAGTIEIFRLFHMSDAQKLKLMDLHCSVLNDQSSMQQGPFAPKQEHSALPYWIFFMWALLFNSFKLKVQNRIRNPKLNMYLKLLHILVALKSS